MQSRYIWYVAGRSGGHIIPALTHAQELLKQDPRYKIGIITTHHPLDRALVHDQSFIFKHCMLPLHNVPRKKSVEWPRFIAQVLWSLCVSAYVLLRWRPERVISMGGYISLPVVCVARLLRIPCDVYELNVVPGQAVTALARMVSRVFICFSQTQTYFPTLHCQKAAYPVRFNDGDKKSKEQACALLKIPADKKIVLILGGSQGSRTLNDLAKKISLSLPDVFFVHQTGPHGVVSLQEFYKEHGIAARVYAFSDQIALYYAAADIVIARAGAGTLFELLFFEKRSFIIPLEAETTAHQVDNAMAMAQAHPQYFTVLRQQDVMYNVHNFIMRMHEYVSVVKTVPVVGDISLGQSESQ